MLWLPIIVLSVVLGGGFGEAEASGTQTVRGTVELELEVQVEISATTVVAHLIDPGSGQQTVALGQRDGRAFGGFVDVSRSDHLVVFEVVDVNGNSIQSRPISLTALGLDPAVIGQVERQPDTVPTPSEPPPWGWLAIGGLAGAAAVLLAGWGPGKTREEEEPNP